MGLFPQPLVSGVEASSGTSLFWLHLSFHNLNQTSSLLDRTTHITWRYHHRASPEGWYWPGNEQFALLGFPPKDFSFYLKLENHSLQAFWALVTSLTNFLIVWIHRLVEQPSPGSKLHPIRLLYPWVYSKALNTSTRPCVFLNSVQSIYFLHLFNSDQKHFKLNSSKQKVAQFGEP